MVVSGQQGNVGLSGAAVLQVDLNDISFGVTSDRAPQLGDAIDQRVGERPRREERGSHDQRSQDLPATKMSRTVNKTCNQGSIPH
ncbi:MAG TPA: hypothetical protein PJ982_10470 [Lacipirellulaceae bacterium]|nr:hypothetical protein [Lacipirellulaceae bacterium]